MNLEKSQHILKAYLASEAYRETHLPQAHEAPKLSQGQQHPAGQAGQPGHVVVGVDGSDVSRRALHWAAEEAWRRGIPLTVCRAWQASSSEHVSTAEQSSDEPASVGERAEQEVRSDVDSVVGFVSGRIQVTPLVLGGSASELLERAAQDASLVVLGDPHRGQRLPHPKSVARHVLSHAPCPVVLVP